MLARETIINISLCIWVWNYVISNEYIKFKIIIEIKQNLWENLNRNNIFE